MNTTLSAASRAKPISWVTMTMVMFVSASDLMTSSTSCTISGSSALVGSSKSMIFGCMLRARAMATRCCCPPESWSGYLSTLSARPTRSKYARPSRSACSRGTLSTLMGASVTFSSTVLWG